MSDNARTAQKVKRLLSYMFDKVFSKARLSSDEDFVMTTNCEVESMFGCSKISRGNFGNYCEVESMFGCPKILRENVGNYPEKWRVYKR